MTALLGFTGAIGSGKTTLAHLMTQYEPDHAWYETNGPIIEIANEFNYLLRREWGARRMSAEDIDLINQVFTRLIPAISDRLHFNATWTQLAIGEKHFAETPEKYERLYNYLQTAHANPSHLEVKITSENKGEFRALLQWLGAYFVQQLSPTIWMDEIMRRAELHNPDTRLVIVSGIRYKSDAEVVREHGGMIIRVERPFQTDDSNDATEAEHKLIIPDITIINNDSLQRLDRVAETVWNDLAAGAPQKRYDAAALTT